MIVPNLASQPFLNTRPVWLVTGVAGLVAAIFVGLNINLYLTSRHDFATQYQRREELQASYSELEETVQELVVGLDRVPWQRLEQRVERFNIILREHSFSWLMLLGDIERVMPYEVRLTSIKPAISKETVSLTLLSVSRSREAMLQFMDNMVNDASFSEPVPKSELTPEGSGAGYTLTLTVTYHPHESQKPQELLGVSQ